MSGWIKAHRSLLEWEWYDDINVMRVFLHCLLKANHEDKKWKGIVIKRGSFITGRDVLAKETGLSVQQIRTALTKLKSTSDITIKSTSKGTLLIVENYSTYQDRDTESNQQNNHQTTFQTTNQQPASNQRVTTNKNDKKERSKEKGSSAELPFDSDAFKKSWDEWQTHRREIRKKLTPSTIKKQLKQLGALKENEAIATINLSIEQGWTGLFPDRFASGGAGQAGGNRSTQSGNRNAGTANAGRADAYADIG